MTPLRVGQRVRHRVTGREGVVERPCDYECCFVTWEGRPPGIDPFRVSHIPFADLIPLTSQDEARGPGEEGRA